MGEFVEETRRSGGSRRRDSAVENGDVQAGATGREGWSERYISSDRDWHFEGNIRYDDFCAVRAKKRPDDDSGGSGGSGGSDGGVVVGT